MDSSAVTDKAIAWSGGPEAFVSIREKKNVFENNTSQILFFRAHTHTDPIIKKPTLFTLSREVEAQVPKLVDGSTDFSLDSAKQFCSEKLLNHISIPNHVFPHIISICVCIHINIYACAYAYEYAHVFWINCICLRPRFHVFFCSGAG